jgi:hypothetical protein
MYNNLDYDIENNINLNILDIDNTIQINSKCILEQAQSQSQSQEQDDDIESNIIKLRRTKIKKNKTIKNNETNTNTNTVSRSNTRFSQVNSCLNKYLCYIVDMDVDIKNIIIKSVISIVLIYFMKKVVIEFKCS